MKSLRNKVILSAIVLGFALIATIGSTYAWFTVSNTVTVESMQLNVLASDSLLIKVDDPTTTDDDSSTNLTEYKTVLTNADISAYYAFSTFKLSPVTAIQSGYATVNPSLLMNMAVGDETNYTRALTATVLGDKNTASGKYIELTFWAYSASATSQEVVLQDLAINLTEITQTAARDDVINAIRLGVWTGDGSTNTHIYGLDHDYAFAFTSGLPGYYDGDPVVAGAFNSIAASTYTLVPETDKFYTTTGSDSTVQVSTKTEATTVFTLASQTPTLVTVRIYVEGWDASATNDIISAAFNISFKFALKNA